MTTTGTVTTGQIQTLRNEAAEAGDFAQVGLCDWALAALSHRSGGHRKAGTDWIAKAENGLAECIRVINAAEAMAEG